jgi:hypothetical protein
LLGVGDTARGEQLQHGNDEPRPVTSATGHASGTVIHDCAAPPT